MKVKTALAVSLLVLFCIVGLAQNNSSQLKSADLSTSIEIPEIHPTGNPFKVIRENPEWVISESTLNTLNADLVNRTFSEKIDSLHGYVWDIDSMMWKANGHEYYLFDAMGRNYSYVDTWYDPLAGGIVPDNKAIITWNTNYQITGITNFDWIDTSTNWIPNNRTLFYFDADGKPVVRTQLDWNVTMGAWEFDMTDTTIYNGRGLVTRRITYSFDDIFKVWEPTYSEDHTYLPNDLPKDFTTYFWIGDTAGFWETNGRNEFYYDDMGRDTLTLGFYWDGETFRDQMRTTSKYNAAGLLILNESFFWNGELLRWEGNSKTEYSFDGNNRPTQTIYFNWDWNKNDWYISTKTTQSWLPSGNLANETEYLFDTITQAYVPTWSEGYDYDLTVPMEDIAMPYFWTPEFLLTMENQQSFKHKIRGVTSYNWNIELSKWDESETDTLFYSPLFNTPIDESDCKAEFNWMLDEKDDLILLLSDASDKSIVAWYWMFGDGQTSTSRNPRHIYKKPGTYKVMLTTTDETGFCTSTIGKQIKIGSPICNAAFSFMVDPIKMAVTLVNQSEGNNLNYFWEFGDGSVDKQRNPVYNYKYPGSYQISLTVSDDLGGCMDKFTASIRAGDLICNADFVIFVDSTSNTVIFRARQNVPTNDYRWVLGDGSVAYGPNRVQQFTHPGHYSAALTVSNKLAGCVETRKESILVGSKSPGGKAAFMYTAGEGNTVSFMNYSLGTDLSYYWDFNDGDASKEKDPLHKYALPGYYDVCLTVTSKDGSQNTYCEKVFAGDETKDLCLAMFEYSLTDDAEQIFLTDRSYGNPDTWAWYFNDTDKSSDQDPIFTTKEPGFVKIRQSILNSENGCIDDAFGLVNMGTKSRLKAAFGYIFNEDNNKAETYPVDFIGVSLGDAGKLKWSFGDGTFDSVSVNPTHVYADPGTYEVCLTITNTSTGEMDHTCEMVNVGNTYRKELLALDEGLISYPNPFSETAQIEIKLEGNTEIDLSLYDLTGRKVKTIARENRMAGTHIFQLNGTDLETGNYYLILETNTRMARQIISIIH